MRSYLKSLTQSLYQKVQRSIEDQYIQPLAQSEIYAIINRKSPYSSSTNAKHSKSPFNRESSQTQQILDNIQRLAMVSPERQFKLIGDAYSIEVISYRMKQLKTKMEAVKEHMVTNYGTHLQAIETALLQIQSINNLAATRLKSIVLRQRLHKLQNLVNKTMKITRLNIKLKNIKQTLKIAQKIPNIKKMHLFELKNINITQINQFKQSIKQLYPKSKQPQLHCIQHLQYFIDKVSSQNLRVIIGDITSCMSQKFINQKYVKAIKGFIISKSDIEFQKLIIRLIETQVRDKVQEQAAKSQQKNLLVFRCKKYITILINLSMIFRWHRYNQLVVDASPEIQEKIRARNNSVTSNCSEKSQDKPQKHPVINLDTEVSIKIHTQQVKLHTCELMDYCLKEQLEQILFNQSIKNQEIFQILCLMNSFFQVAFSFSSFVFEQTTNNIKQLLLRKSYKLQQKGLNDVTEALLKQQQNQWNRLPLLKSYRFKSLQRTLQRVKKLHLYDRVPFLTVQNFKFLNIQAQTSPEDIFQQLVSDQKQQSLQLQQVQFPYQKLQKTLSYQINESPLPQHQDPQVVICKSSLSILSYFEQFLSMYVYFPIKQVRQVILDKMLFFLEYYVYYLFNTFLSEMYKKIFFDKYQTLEQLYLQVRVRFLYNQVYWFIVGFQESKKNHNHSGNHTGNHQYNHVNISSKQNGTTKKVSIEMLKYKSRGYSFIKAQIKESKVSQENIIKARALATDSIKFLTAYLFNIVNHLQKYTLQNTESNQSNSPNAPKTHFKDCITKLQSYKLIYTQLSDLLLTDITPTSTKIDFVQPIMKKIKWHQIQNSKEITDYGLIILKSIRQTYDKMKSMSKGEIPFYLIDKIFSFYWKTQLTFITKIFLEEHVANKQKGGRNSKTNFQKLIDTLYEGLLQFLDPKPKSTKQLSSLINSSKNIPSQYSTQRIELMKSIYLKIKNIFPMLYQKNLQQCQTMVCESLKNFQFIYKIEISIMKASESCSGQSQGQIDQNIREIDTFIKEEIIKKAIY